MNDDLISRQAVLDRKYVVEVKNMWHMTEEIEVVNVDDIKALPSVNPQEPKTGCWEYGYAFADGKYGKCSECKKLIKCTYPMHYCPNCGAKMESEGV